MYLILIILVFVVFLLFTFINLFRICIKLALLKTLCSSKGGQILNEGLIGAGTVLLLSAKRKTRFSLLPSPVLSSSYSDSALIKSSL